MVSVKYPQAALHKNHLQAWTNAFCDTGMDHFESLEDQRARKVWGLLLIYLTISRIFTPIPEQKELSFWWSFSGVRKLRDNFKPRFFPAVN
jgi:hypothetical protein